MGDLTRSFSRWEFACRCGCGADHVDPELVRNLQLLRDQVGLPINVNSGVRCAKHNKAERGKPKSYHLVGKAADIWVHGWSTQQLAEAVLRIPAFRGLGFYDTFLHVDIRPRRYTWRG